MTFPTSSSCAVVLLPLLIIMDILIAITFTVDLVANCYMKSAWVFCSAGVSFHPVFSSAKWLSLSLGYGVCERMVKVHCTAQDDSLEVRPAAVVLWKRPQSALTNLLMLFHSIRQAGSPRAVSLPICSCHPCTPCWELAEKASSFSQSLLALWTRSLWQGACKQSNLTRSWNVTVSDQNFAFSGVRTDLDQLWQKEKQNLYKVKVGESCLQSTPPNSVPSGRERRVKEGIVNVMRSAKASDTAAHATSGDGYWKTGSFGGNMNH